jgi:ubiquinone/menaquinone biosynthesis C-methylase UbiE
MTQDADQRLEEHRQSSYELWERMAPVWERRRNLNWDSSRKVSEWLVDRIDPQPGQTILELAAATGETGFLAASRIGQSGRLISSDFSPEMVRSAQNVAQELGIANADFRVLDAERLELEDDAVDGILCRFAYMLVAEPVRALREARRVLRPGGRLAFSTWAGREHNPWMTFSAGLMIERGLMQPLGSGGPGMFALPDAASVTPLLAEAGFGEVDVEEMELTWRYNSADELWIFVSELQGPVALAIAKLDEAQRESVRSEIEERAAPFAADGGYDLPGLALNVVAA